MRPRKLGLSILIASIVLAVMGGLTLWGGLFVRDQVTDQLTAQQIFFAPAGSEGLPANIQQYGGTQVTNGDQAKVFADKYIEVHVQGSIAGAAKNNPAALKDVTTYSGVSGASRANPDNEELSALVQTVFRGEMLRSSLLNSYGWGMFGTILMWAGISILSISTLGLLSSVAVLGHLRSRVTHWRDTHHKHALPA
jgi:hypothetical protein